MKAIQKQFKFAYFVVLISGLCTSCIASNQTSVTISDATIDVALATDQIELQKVAEAIKFELLNAPMPLLFAAEIEKIYSEREYLPIWTNKEAKKIFLKEYALFVASGVSHRSALALKKLDETTTDVPIYDILLTEAFLDYLSYSNHLSVFAQKWLYAVNKYKPMTLPSELIVSWQNALQMEQQTSFIQKFATSNVLYQQTVEYLVNSFGDSNISDQLRYKLALNAQRLRVIPNFTNGIFVNIPSYQLEYYRDGQLVLNSPVIVGKKSRRTPVLQSRLSNVVVNPPWTVPNTILTNDFVPKLAADPSYAERSSLEIFDSNGNKISAYDVDWGQYAHRKSVPFTLRQKAGDDSALGRFKFNMPSSDAIYLHDTPNRGLFKRKSRALSSGCVRVAKSDELATILLEEAGWSAERKKAVLASKKTTSAPIQSDNPVYLYYVTSWVDNGQIQHLPDIYNYDKNKPPAYIDWSIIQKYL